MSASVIALVKQVETLSAAETLELIMALLQRTRNVVEAVDTPKQQLDWSDLRGIYQSPMLGEDAQLAVNRLREEWDDR